MKLGPLLKLGPNKSSGGSRVTRRTNTITPNSVCDHINTRFAIKADKHGQHRGWEADSFLGCLIERDWDAHTVSLSLPVKLQELMTLAGMTDCNSRASPGVPHSALKKAQSDDMPLSSSTFDQLADPFTKTVSGPETTRFRNWMLRGELPTDLDLRMATTLSATPG